MNIKQVLLEIESEIDYNLNLVSNEVKQEAITKLINYLNSLKTK